MPCHLINPIPSISCCSLGKLAQGQWEKTYAAFVERVRRDYPSPIKVFIGCGPMSETWRYCPLLQSIVNLWRSNGDQNMFLLDFRIGGMMMAGCLAHPTWCVSSCSRLPT